MEQRKPNLRSFIAAFRADWMDALSGGFSVPFVAFGVVLALFAKDSEVALIGAIVFLVMAFFGAWFSSYRVWAAEVVRIGKLEDRLTPKLRVTFAPDANGIVAAVARTQVFHSMSASGTPIVREESAASKY